MKGCVNGMHYIWHYGFMGSRIGELKEVLETKYKIETFSCYTPDKARLLQITFDVEETHPKFKEISEMIAQDTWDTSDYPIESNGVSVYIPVYSEEELTSAKWLTVRSSFSKVIVENEQDICQKACIFGEDSRGDPRARHIYECGECVVRSPLKWGRHFIASSITNEHRLFCNDSARTIFENNHISGIDFQAVVDLRTKLPMENAYHMANAFTVPNGSIVGLEYTEPYVCPTCGMDMLCWSDPRFKFGVRARSIPDEVDFCRTLPLFIGQSPDKTYGAHALTLVSQKMYRVLKQNMLDRSLWFEPVTVIE